MKCLREEISSTDSRKRWVFALGKQEVELLCAALVNAKRYTPKVLGTSPTISRITQMIREMRKVIPGMQEDRA